jgi:hypothetical protein
LHCFVLFVQIEACYKNPLFSELSFDITNLVIKCEHEIRLLLL